MNKDVIYIEPEDDITDIITKIEKSKEKIIALVPPKKAGVFRSIVNIKLIAKAGASADKKVVLVTVDPSITKLAGATNLPVAKNLQSAPEIPAVEPEEPVEEHSIGALEEPEEEEPQENDAADNEPAEEKPKVADEGDADWSNLVEEEKDEEDEDEDEEEEKHKKAKKKHHSNKLVNWIKNHKKTTIFACIVLVGLIGFLIWAFAFAPAADVTVAIKTDQKNFSENITFTDKLTDENAKEGKFYIEEKKLETVQEVEFEATGQKNRGAKATGEVTVSAMFDAEGSVAINTGTIFTINGLSYAADGYKALAWDGEEENCENDKKISGGKIQCLISETVKVTAVEGGSKYNIGASSTGWSTVANINVYSKSAMSGGTDDVITVVQQSDVERAKSELTTAKEEENKNKLYETIDTDKYYVIDNSFSQTTSAATATPGVDEEVSGDTKPVLKATTTAKVYVIDKTKLEEFIDAKAELEDNQKIYEVKDIYIDDISQVKVGATTKLKAQYYIGPKITEGEVVDKIKGRGLGDAQREIRDIYGVSNVTINTSYPWVMTIPSDSNKVTVKFEVKDQNGQEIKGQTKQNNEENTEDNEGGEAEDEKAKEDEKK